MTVSKKGHKPWDLCECGHAWTVHSKDDGPCVVSRRYGYSSKCDCKHFAWRAIPEAIDDLKVILKDLQDKEES